LLHLGYVAVLGGALPVTWLAFVNSGRLGVSRVRRLLIVATGLVVLAGEILLAGWLYPDGDVSWSRLTPVRVLAAAGYLVQLRLQRPMDRAFQLRGGEHQPRIAAGHLVLIGLGAGLEILLLAVASS
jgi:hypothetical protein